VHVDTSLVQWSIIHGEPIKPTATVAVLLYVAYRAALNRVIGGAIIRQRVAVVYMKSRFFYGRSYLLLPMTLLLPYNDHH